MTTYSDAINNMYGTFKTAWDNGASPIIGYVPDVEYDEPDEEDRAPLDKAFARLAVRNLNEGLVAMGNCGNDTKLYETVGVLVVQVFVPKKDNNGVVTGRALAVLVRDAYRAAGVNGEVWFKNATIREQTPGKRWRQFNVNVEYDFTETT